MQRAQNALLDYLAVTMAGAKANKTKWEAYLKCAAPEAGNSTLIGMPLRTNLKEAVFLNGFNAHTLDFDDGTNTGIIHLGSVVFSVLIPLAEKYAVSLEKMLQAAVIGYETSFTMAVSIQPGHKAMGYHATGTCGVLGAAMAASYLLDFSESERRNAFAIAAVSAGGMLKVLDDASELKPYNVAKSALLGLIAAQMAKADIVGNTDPLGGHRGYLKMMTGREDIRFAEPLLNGTYAIEKTYTKPYAACRYCHPAIEAAIKLGKEIEPSAIKGVSIRTYDLAVSGHDHTQICGVGSAKMSIPYGVCVGILDGRAGLMEYDRAHISDDRILGLLKKVAVEAETDFSEAFPEKQMAVVEIELLSGEKIREKVDYPKGEPQNPLSREEFRERFEGLLQYAGISSDTGDRIVEACEQRKKSVDGICQLLSL
ncbi:MAG: MmgE/PrpD family protein, partial [bacterium]|nr:MmgE/PrpD family protein [bacterium]